MFSIRPSRQDMYADDPKFLWKYILRSLAIILAIISIGLIGWSLANRVVPNNIYNIYNNDDWLYNNNISLLPWEFITLGLSTIWNVANILVLLIRNRPIHPGANVACDLLLWLGLIVTGIFASAGANPYFWDAYYIPSDNDSSYLISPNGTITSTTSAAPTSSPCDGCTAQPQQQSYNNALNHRGILIALGAALGFFVLLMHFALFVSACRYTNARRVNATAAVIVERLCSEKVGREGLRNPNAGFVPISEPLEQQAPLHYGMPPAQTGMTVGEQGRRRAVVEEEKEEKEGRGRVRGTRDSCERPEVVVQGVSGGDAAAGPACGNDVYEA